MTKSNNKHHIIGFITYGLFNNSGFLQAIVKDCNGHSYCNSPDNVISEAEIEFIKETKRLIKLKQRPIDFN